MADFLSSWDTTKTSVGSSNADQIHLPLHNGGTYDFVIDWGDGGPTDHITVWNQAETTHTYASAGPYDLTIAGTCTGWRFNNTGDRLKILDISQWGTLKFGNLGSYFYGCENLTATATDVPDLTGTTALTNCFRGCLAFTSDLSAWDVHAVTNMYAIFRDCHVFNSDLSGWDVHAVTDMYSMFCYCYAFTSDLSGWDVHAVTNLQSTFYGCYDFTSDLSGWDVHAVTNMYAMFHDCHVFNSDLSAWDVHAVTNMTYMLTGANTFSSLNYSKALLAWSAQSLQASVTLGGGTRKYYKGTPTAARASIIANHGWTITDGGQEPGYSPFEGSPMLIADGSFQLT